MDVLARDSVRCCHSGHLPIVARETAGRGSRTRRQGRAGHRCVEGHRAGHRGLARRRRRRGDALVPQAGGARRSRGRDRRRPLPAPGSPPSPPTRASPTRPRRVWRRRVERLGALDILVNNAATNPTTGPPSTPSSPAWDKTFQVNVRGAFVWSQLAWRAWMRDHGGSIINISSIGGLRGDAAIGVYNITKAAIVHLTRILAVELGPGVRVNAIAPGLVKTDFARALWEPAGDRGRRRPPAAASRRRPRTSPHAARFLAGPGASWITGDTLVVDGGALAGAAPISPARRHHASRRADRDHADFESFDGLSLSYHDEGDGRAGRAAARLRRRHQRQLRALGHPRPAARRGLPRGRARRCVVTGSRRSPPSPRPTPTTR